MRSSRMVRRVSAKRRHSTIRQIRSIRGVHSLRGGTESRGRDSTSLTENAVASAANEVTLLRSQNGIIFGCTLASWFAHSLVRVCVCVCV